MAPYSRTSAHGPQSHGQSNGLNRAPVPMGVFDAPPSTMAAQLISNLATTNPPNGNHRVSSREPKQDELKRLMVEVSELENSGHEPTDVVVKLEHKHKLVYVFARAVLERLNHDDPFMNIPQLISQASDALDIFTSTITEVPLVLDYTSNSVKSFPTRGPEPLWVWLFPRLLTLFGRPGCDPLTAKIKDFFQVCFQVVSKSPKLWKLNFLFFSYLKDCTSAILNHLPNSNILTQGKMGELILPDAFGYLVYSTDESSTTNPTPFCTYTIRDPGHAFSHVVSLLNMLVDVSVESASTWDATPAFQDYVAWVLDSFAIVHDIRKRWESNPRLRECSESSAETILHALHSLISSLKSSLSDSVLRKGYLILTTFCAEILETPYNISGESSLLCLCRCLLNIALASRKHDSIQRAVSIHLFPTIRFCFDDQDILLKLGNDFQKATSILSDVCKVELSKPPQLITYDTYDSVELNMEFSNLMIDKVVHETSHDGPPSKRRKVEESNETFGQVVGNLYSILGAQVATDLDGLSNIAESCFAVLNVEDQCKAIDHMSRIPCAAYGSLQVNHNADGTIRDSKCPVCEGVVDPDMSNISKTRCQSVSTEAVATFTALVKSSVFLDSRRPRVMAMFALRRFTVHFEDLEFFDLEKSPLGQWCLQSLRSSIRELRITAGRTLVGFLRDLGSAEDLTRKNRFNVLQLLRSFAENGNLQFQETCVLALGQVGRIFDDEELNIVLLSLVGYLGHSNPIISGVAFNEILKLAKANGVTVDRMFSPCWGTIAIEVIKDLLVRPQTTQLMADLLAISVSEFLILTQTHTLPWLVLLGKTDVIKKIADARGEKDAELACMETSNMVAILPLLLTQTGDIENVAMARLKAVSPKFQDVDFAKLMKVAPGSQAFYLLKAAGEADLSKKSRIHFALGYLAKHASEPSEGSRKKKNTVGMFLEQHLLGLVARLSEVVNDPRDEHPTQEKQRCVKAFEELVKVAKTHARAARPQICACLQSALDHKILQSAAMSAWGAILTYLGDEDVEPMLESTFSTIIQRWETFNGPTRKTVEDFLQYLIKNRAHLIRNMIVFLPSLGHVPDLSEIESQINKWRKPTDAGNAFQIFSRRIGHENPGVVIQALVELRDYLQVEQSFLQMSAIGEQPDIIVATLVRSVLDTCVKFNGSHNDIARLSAECIGLIGCLDPNRVESVREQKEMVVVSNFEDSSETTDFVLFMLEEVIVKAFLSATDTAWQGFLSYVMQELLWKCDFKEICATGTRNAADEELYEKWCRLPINVQDTLTPFLTSKYSLLEGKLAKVTYPIFNPDNAASGKMYVSWLRSFVLDLLQKQFNLHANIIFPALYRAIRIKDISIASFLLPYVALHVVTLGADQHRKEITEELLRILTYDVEDDSKTRKEELKLCLEAVFRILDYFSRWIQEKQAKLSRRHTSADAPVNPEVQRVELVLSQIPPEIIAQRAVECKSYSRALFYWEQHIRHVRKDQVNYEAKPRMLERLQDIYTQIDEPDGIEGISAHLHVLDIEQQILGHRKAGRWTAAQSWYEIKLAENPDDVDVQVNLLTCLKESGQHDVLLNYIEGMRTATDTTSRLLPFATEASWSTGRWLALSKYTSMAPKGMSENFNVRVGQALLALHAKDSKLFQETIQATRKQIATSLSVAATASIGDCHDNMLKLHVLTELEMIAGVNPGEVDRPKVLGKLKTRLEMIGAYLNDKQYLLGIRRAAMQLSSASFTQGDVAEAWLTSARLARKGNAMHQSFNAVLHASQLKDESATIEHARLLWKEGHHRKAIQNLQGAIENNAFISHNREADMTTYTGVDSVDQQNFLTARAHLLLAKWMDSAGQTNAASLRTQYQLAAKTHSNWEKGHYYLGRHYNKILEAEKSQPPELQSEKCLTGETAKLVIENYLRSLNYGTKYLYQTLPRLLTLWLELGTQINQPIDPRHGGNSKEFVTGITNRRKDHLQNVHLRFTKYISKMPAYMFYTALPQIVARINHPNPDVSKFLTHIIYKVVAAHPQQALWSLLAVCSSTQMDRKTKGVGILQSLRGNSSKKSETSSIDIKSLIKSGERLADQLLLACNAGDFQGNRTTTASLSKDLGFNQKTCLPSPMAVPVERVLTATLPTLTDNIKTHKAFSRDIVTMQSFSDEVLVLSSLQKPRKLVARGSDGKEYGLMCKPKDDLRKDQRLMEFNSMINRALKRDAEASRRQLYIKTYAVTPLNEECGLIEWVEGLKTLRDILLALYKAQGIGVNYKEIEAYCDEACRSDEKLPFFTQKVLGQFPPVFHKWFVQQFPEPLTWFAARLRYTRSCAVMSMVGTMLGLGDRHGENILFEEGNGGTFHVDFNCLFEKGLTFHKPERVPFRLTHNMVDAMGMYGYEGPFRKSSELTLKLLRQHQETLMTILEAFIYDPTLDLLKKVEKRKKEGVYTPPQTAQGVLDNIRRKVKGLMPNESVPLGVEGQVEELISQATNQKFLAGMYIGWCSFF
ncbi:hypothetical protein HYALB_00009347 [Hymenoscyphus albidus]|uniref:non-specific serine/threonine protein kinase n=1 Tax=Hymenoscyphus albidus TaxID=595503 RepID=A0A9N9Q2I0_9HELO|nr:hypothetical protein HYALB_00009347 [Hymenoscyphus albidus]